MESPKLEKTNFRTMLLNTLNEELTQYDLPSDPKEIEELAKKVINECIKLNSMDNHSNNDNEVL